MTGAHSSLRRGARIAGRLLLPALTEQSSYVSIMYWVAASAPHLK